MSVSDRRLWNFPLLVLSQVSIMKSWLWGLQSTIVHKKEFWNNSTKWFSNVFDLYKNRVYGLGTTRFFYGGAPNVFWNEFSGLLKSLIASARAGPVFRYQNGNEEYILLISFGIEGNSFPVSALICWQQYLRTILCFDKPHLDVYPAPQVLEQHRRLMDIMHYL